MLSLARSLLLADAVTREALGEALLHSAARGTCLVRALLATGAIDAGALERHLDRGDAPRIGRVVPVRALVEQLPEGICERLLAAPVRRDARTGTIDVALADASDSHAAEELGYWLGAPVRIVRAPLASIEAAVSPRAPGESGESGGDAADADAALDSPEDPNIPFALTRRSLAPGTLRGPFEAPAPPATLRGPFAGAGAPATLRGPFAVPVDPPPSPWPDADLEPLLEAIRASHDRDEILSNAVAAARAFSRGAAVLAVRRGELSGWACSAELGEAAAWRAMRWSPATSALGEALEREDALVVELPQGEIPPAAANPELLLGPVVLQSVRVEGRPVAVLLAAGPPDFGAAARRLDDVARAAGAALTQALARRRRG